MDPHWCTRCTALKKTFDAQPEYKYEQIFWDMLKKNYRTGVGWTQKGVLVKEYEAEFVKAGFELGVPIEHNGIAIQYFADRFELTKWVTAKMKSIGYRSTSTNRVGLVFYGVMRKSPLIE
jgi:hypothetical protein